MSEIEIQPGTVAELPLKLVDYDWDQPRKDIDDDYIEELADSIRAEGLKQPITVRPNPEQEGRFYVVFGECRTRAHRLARKRTIRAVLADKADTTDDLTRYLDQVKENYQRRDLNAMELAQVLEQLHARFGLRSNKAIEETLSKHGIKRMSREYVANMRRLLGLPDWAKELIRAGTWTGSHGKYLLQATASDAVMETLRYEVEGVGPDNFTTRKLQVAIYHTFDEHYPKLTGHTCNFDYAAECVGCQKMRKVSDGTQSDTFCLDRSCFSHRTAAGEALRRKNEEAARHAEQRHQEERQAPEDTEAEPSDTDPIAPTEEQQLSIEDDYRLLDMPGIVFDTGECSSCEHRRSIEVLIGERPACHNVKCFSAKQQAETARRLRERNLEYAVVRYIQQQILENHLAEDPILQHRLICWLALAGPKHFEPDLDSVEWLSVDYGDGEALELLEQTLTEHGHLRDLSTLLDPGLDVSREVAELAVRLMHMSPSPEPLITLAKICGITIDAYRIDDDYCDCHTIEELTALIRTASEADRIEVNSKLALLPEDVDAVQDADKYCLRLKDSIGVPDDIRAAWEKLVSRETDQEADAA